MSKYTSPYKTSPVTGGGLAGSNVTYGNITVGTAIPTAVLSYTTATTATWAHTQSKIKITDKDIELDGWSLRETLQTITERLAVLQPNPALEREFDDLRACADRYRELEKKLLDQKAMWDTLKKTDQ
jgi:hypothetical protein